MNTKTEYSFQISGDLIGNNWYNQSCSKQIKVNCRFDGKQFAFCETYENLYDALEHITNDGDFTSCKLSADTKLKVTKSTWKEDKDYFNNLKLFETVTRYYDMSSFPVAEEFMTDEYADIPEWEYESED
jgi:hypothetical protein